jgi:hypothetical protein
MVVGIVRQKCGLEQKILLTHETTVFAREEQATDRSFERDTVIQVKRFDYDFIFVVGIVAGRFFE